MTSYDHIIICPTDVIDPGRASLDCPFVLACTTLAPVGGAWIRAVELGPRQQVFTMFDCMGAQYACTRQMILESPRNKEEHASP